MKDQFYLCACSSDEKGGIYLYELPQDGKLSLSAFYPLPETNFLCFSPDRKFLYATVNRKESGGGAAAFRIQSDGSLVFLNELESDGQSACYLTCSPDGRFLYCANYKTGSFAEFELGTDGSILRRTQLIRHSGSGPRKDRQESAHVHCTVVSPDGKWLCVNDLGTDSVMLYPLSEKGVSLPARQWKAEPGEGPRHILFDRNGKIAYVINELGNSVTSLRYSDGTLERIGCFSTLPDPCDVKTKASAIRLSPDEKFLYASNRGFDSIACFRVTEPGKLDLFDIVASFGSSPRDVNYLPGNRFFAACNEFSDVTCFYDADPVSGKLTYKEGFDLNGLPRPLYLLF